MITPDELVQVIQHQIPGAQVEVRDKTGAQDHYQIQVTSAQFQDMNLMDRHRTVMNALSLLMQTGRLHAAEIKTELPA